MTRYRLCASPVQADRWHRHGDHPAVRRLPESHPAHRRTLSCCGSPGAAHGMLPGSAGLVCPGDWVITSPDGIHGAVHPGEFAARYEKLPEPVTLTDRQHQVLSGIARGLTRTAIATELHVEPNTIKTHVRNLLRALDAHDRAHAVALAYRAGLLPGADR